MTTYIFVTERANEIDHLMGFLEDPKCNDKEYSLTVEKEKDGSDLTIYVEGDIILESISAILKEIGKVFTGELEINLVKIEE